MPCAHRIVRKTTAKPKRERRCVVCGETGHRLETCTTPAAALIRKLKSKLPMRKQIPRKPTRLLSRKGGSCKMRARVGYTVALAAGRAKLGRRLPVHERCGQGLLSVVGAASLVAASKMQQAGYVGVMSTCPSCNADTLGLPYVRASGHVWQQCCDGSCRHMFNIMQYAKFAGTKLTPAQVGLMTRLNSKSYPWVLH